MSIASMTVRLQISSILLVILTSLTISTPIRAQSNIISDDTLGAESSQVIPNFDGDPAEVILGGAVREQNLFHSFEAFNVDAGRFAFFFVPDGVDNVLSRVTGSDPSNILGVLGTIGGATPDLYLINPNGIIFGPDARLAVDGSFIATTAEGIQLGEADRYSTVNPESSSLLTVNPSALLFGSRIGAIASQGDLRVDGGQSLIFAGGNIEVEGGSLYVLFGESGDVELAAVGESGTVELSESNGLLGLNLPVDLARADISLANTTLQAVGIRDGGDVAVTGRNINVLGSQIQTGILQNTGSAASAVGDISLDASEVLSIESASQIRNVILENAQGNGGDIKIRAGSVLAEGSEISASTFGQGDAGDIILQTGEMALNATDVFSVVWDDGIGNAGDIAIDVSNLLMTNGAQISASSFGQGSTGNVIIKAENSVSLDGFPTAIFSSLFGSSDERGGDIRITARDLSLTNSAKLDTSINGPGEGGDVIIVAEDSVTIDGGIPGEPGSSIFSTVEEPGQGSSGDINITTGSLFVTNGGNIQTLVRGQGDAGDIFIQANDSVLVDGFVIQGETTLPGFDGVVRLVISSAITSAVTNEDTADGNGGDIYIQAGESITLSDSGEVSSSIGKREAVGNAGNITLESNLVTVDRGRINSSSVGRGNAGNILIRSTDRLVMDNEARLVSFTDGIGNAGEVRIGAGNSVVLSNDSTVFTIVGDDGVGSGGDIFVNTGSLLLETGSQFLSRTFGRGDAGSVTVIASDEVRFRSRSSGDFLSGIIASAESDSIGAGGDIYIAAPSVFFIDGAALVTGTSGSGGAGDIQIDAEEQVLLTGVSPVSGTPNILIASTASPFGSAGGTVTVNTANLNLQDGARISAQSFGTGSAGSIVLNVSEILQMIDSDIQTTAIASSGGDILINLSEASKLGITLLIGDADILTESLGNGGNITLGGAAVIALDDSDIVARSQSGQGGNISLSSFFSEDIPPDNQPPFDGDDRVDVNADGQIAAGVINSPETSFVENSFSELSETIVDTEQLVSGSCIARADNDSRFTITGQSRLSERPDNAPGSTYSTGTVQSVATEVPMSSRQADAQSVEPQGVYYLTDGRMVLSRECL
ncbi:MAG: filamentous hemagglutinin N-terminal domain-containing protein [Phormidesmis sp.]